MFSFLLSLCFAEDLGQKIEFDKEIEVIGNSNYLIYIDSPKIISKPNNLKIRDDLFFHYISLYKGLIEERGEYGYYPIGEKIKIYSKDTIKFEYEDCNFEKNAKKCCYENDIWLLEPTITFNENQIVTSMIMYDSSMQPIAQSAHTSDLIVEYKERKKITELDNSYNIGGTQRNCYSNYCPELNIRGGNISNRRREIEQLEDQERIFNPKFIESNVRQASIYIMSSIRIK